MGSRQSPQITQIFCHPDCPCGICEGIGVPKICGRKSVGVCDQHIRASDQRNRPWDSSFGPPCESQGRYNPRDQGGSCSPSAMLNVEPAKPVISTSLALGRLDGGDYPESER